MRGGGGSGWSLAHGPARHFVAAQEVSRFRGKADINQPTIPLNPSKMTRNGHATRLDVTYVLGRRFVSWRLDYCYAPQADATLGQNEIGGVMYVSA